MSPAFFLEDEQESDSLAVRQGAFWEVGGASPRSPECQCFKANVSSACSEHLRAQGVRIFILKATNAIGSVYLDFKTGALL